MLVMSFAETRYTRYVALWVGPGLALEIVLSERVSGFHQRLRVFG
jgi:hypothetical protein